MIDPRREVHFRGLRHIVFFGPEWMNKEVGRKTEDAGTTRQVCKGTLSHGLMHRTNKYSTGRAFHMLSQIHGRETHTAHKHGASKITKAYHVRWPGVGAASTFVLQGHHLNTSTTRLYASAPTRIYQSSG